MNKIRFRHFYDKEVRWESRLGEPDVKRKHERKGRLVATIATQENDNGTIAVAIARVNPCEQGTKYQGRSIANERLQCWQLSKEGPSHSATYETVEDYIDILRKQNLAFDTTKEKIVDMIYSNPFLKRSCPYGQRG